MGRPAKAIKSIEKNVSFDEDLVAQVDLMLWSEVEGKVPHGAWKRYLDDLIRRDLEERRKGK